MNDYEEVRKMLEELQNKTQETKRLKTKLKTSLKVNVVMKMYFEFFKLQ